MKSQCKGFLSGVLTTALVGTIAVSALAASGRMTIEVDPINIQVNGEVFQPRDANGNSVPVFAYNGTTYAPLRALAEAYGLEVGYDSGKNMATVGAANTVPDEPKPTTTPTPDTTAKGDYSDWSAEDEAAYQEFKGLWEIELRDKGNQKYNVFGEADGTPYEDYNLATIKPYTYEELSDILSAAKQNGFIERLKAELCTSNSAVTVFFILDNDGVGGLDGVIHSIF